MYTHSGHAEHERYLTAFFFGGGFTNAFITLSNQIYISILTHPFDPGHLAWEAGFLPVGEVFDLGRWALAIHTDILEFEQINVYPDEIDKEQLGCWSIWAVGQLKRPNQVGIRSLGLSNWVNVTLVGIQCSHSRGSILFHRRIMDATTQRGSSSPD